jgi:hypothetical protein
MMPTTPPTVVPNANFVFSGRVYEWRFDPDQDMFGEMPRYIQRVNNEEVLLFGAYSPSGYDVENYIASNWTDWNGDYAISLGLNTPHRNFTYYYLSPSGAFPGGPWQYFNATSSEGKTHASTYGRVIYYSTPLTGKTGKGNDFMLYTRNTSQTTVYPTLVVKNATLVPPMNIVTPTMLVQQSPVNASGGDQEPSSAPSGYFLGVVGIATLAIIGAGVWLTRKIPIPSGGTEDLQQYGSQLDAKHRGITETEDLKQYGSLQDDKHRGI